ncbi:hypothetical protein LSCM1_04782 [Leishmania martiniquensis]|uniref:Uncharacterized protein n=1 Tax=Leishmania martiniquensis TaxID=1580590 RepID=A0A836HKB3_9TRYP|nr:hypothetical protein LSCM1_04782 [Leishmania martiniquensis]
MHGWTTACVSLRRGRRRRRNPNAVTVTALSQRMQRFHLRRPQSFRPTVQQTTMQHPCATTASSFLTTASRVLAVGASGTAVPPVNDYATAIMPLAADKSIGLRCSLKQE